MNRTWELRNKIASERRVNIGSCRGVSGITTREKLIRGDVYQHKLNSPMPHFEVLIMEILRHEQYADGSFETKSLGRHPSYFQKDGKLFWKSGVITIELNTDKDRCLSGECGVYYETVPDPPGYIEPRVLNTEEVFRVTYEIADGFDGEVHRLMKQTYNDKPPFYFRVKGRNLTNVETSSSDLQEIIKYYERSYMIDRKIVLGWQERATTKQIAEYCANKTKEFLDKLKEFAAVEQPHNNAFAADTKGAAKLVAN